MLNALFLILFGGLLRVSPNCFPNKCRLLELRKTFQTAQVRLQARLDEFIQTTPATHHEQDAGFTDFLETIDSFLLSLDILISLLGEKPNSIESFRKELNAGYESVRNCASAVITHYRNCIVRQNHQLHDDGFQLGPKFDSELQQAVESLGRDHEHPLPELMSPETLCAFFQQVKAADLGQLNTYLYDLSHENNLPTTVVYPFERRPAHTDLLHWFLNLEEFQSEVFSFLLLGPTELPVLRALEILQRACEIAFEATQGTPERPYQPSSADLKWWACVRAEFPELVEPLCLEFLPQGFPQGETVSVETKGRRKPQAEGRRTLLTETMLPCFSQNRAEWYERCLQLTFQYTLFQHRKHLDFATAWFQDEVCSNWETEATRRKHLEEILPETVVNHWTAAYSETLRAAERTSETLSPEAQAYYLWTTFFAMLQAEVCHMRGNVASEVRNPLPMVMSRFVRTQLHWNETQQPGTRQLLETRMEPAQVVASIDSPGESASQTQPDGWVNLHTTIQTAVRTLLEKIPEIQPARFADTEAINDCLRRITKTLEKATPCQFVETVPPLHCSPESLRQHRRPFVAAQQKEFRKLAERCLNRGLLAEQELVPSMISPRLLETEPSRNYAEDFADLERVLPDPGSETWLALSAQLHRAEHWLTLTNKILDSQTVGDNDRGTQQEQFLLKLQEEYPLINQQEESQKKLREILRAVMAELDQMNQQVKRAKRCLEKEGRFSEMERLKEFWTHVSQTTQSVFNLILGFLLPETDKGLSTLIRIHVDEIAFNKSPVSEWLMHSILHIPTED